MEHYGLRFYGFRPAPNLSLMFALRRFRADLREHRAISVAERQETLSFT